MGFFTRSKPTPCERCLRPLRSNERDLLLRKTGQDALCKGCFLDAVARRLAGPRSESYWQLAPRRNEDKTLEDEVRQAADSILKSYKRSGQ